MFTPPSSTSRLVKELKLRIKEMEQIVGEANKDSDLPTRDFIRATKLKGLISYKDLKFATENFSEENKLEGGFGAVYKGSTRDGKEVAVKKLTLQNSRRLEEDFVSEVMLISDAHHPNLVQLLGWCSKGRDRILVYEYMKNNSLDRFLFGFKTHCNLMASKLRAMNYNAEEQVQAQLAQVLYLVHLSSKD